jgi:RimJ/RimL family protein N-acetyltransferase
MSGLLDQVATITGRLVNLRPISREDYPTLYRWRSSFDTIHLLNYRRRIAPFEEFTREIEALATSGILLIVMDQREAGAIGYAAAVNVNPWDRWASVGMYVEPAYRNRGHGGEAALLAVEAFFSIYPLDKLVTEIYEFADSLLAMTRAMGFEEVGTMPDHYWYGDRRWTLYHMVLTRERWQQCRERFSDVIAVQRSYDELQAAKS